MATDTTINSDSNNVDNNMSTLVSELVSALVSGARAVQNLPLSDEFEFQSSFPEFKSIWQSNQSEMVDIFSLIVHQLLNNNDNSRHDNNNNNDDDDDDDINVVLNDETEHLLLLFDDLNDSKLDQSCIEVCETLIEQVEMYLSNATTISQQQQQQQLNCNKNSKHDKFGQLLDGLCDMEKPQKTYQLPIPSLDRATPFIPPIRSKPHAIVPLDLSLRSGHGYETRFGALRSSKKMIMNDPKLANNIVAPKHHVPHVYQTEIDQLDFDTHFLSTIVDSKGVVPKPSNTISKKNVLQEDLQATWIDTTEALQELISKIIENKHDDNDSSCIDMIAIDLEAHSYRSFAGLVCLMQLSFIQHGTVYNYLIDPFPLWDDMQLLGTIFANPKILKVFHGADSDIQWLQRDFGLYIVNLFDTGRAARALELESASYAQLCMHYANIKLDKAYQLSDWRQRPIPNAMKQYAIMDTYYLIQIVPHVLYDLYQAGEGQQQQGGRRGGGNNNDQVGTTSMLRDVWETSRKISLIRYCPDPFRLNGHSAIYTRVKSQMKKAKRILPDSTLQQLQSMVRRLYEWRDGIARDHDESVTFVCTNTQLVRLVMDQPTTLTQLQSLFNPMPPLLVRYSSDVLTIIHDNTNSNATSSMNKIMSFNQAPTVDTNDQNNNKGSRTNKSIIGFVPVTTTTTTKRHFDEYDEEEEVIVTSSSSEDEKDCSDHPNKRRRRTLAIHPANENFTSRQLSLHGLDLTNNIINNIDGNDNGRGRTVSGLKTVQVIQDGLESVNNTNKVLVSNDPKLAKAIATRIQSSFGTTRTLGLFYDPTTFSSSDEKQNLGNIKKESAHVVTETTKEKEVDAIPKSLRETYGTNKNNMTPLETSDKSTTTTTTTNTAKTATPSQDNTNTTLPPPPTFDYSATSSMGVFPAAAVPANPFFTGAALEGGHLAQQLATTSKPPKSNNKNKVNNNDKEKSSQSAKKQAERPGKRSDGRAQAFKR